METVLFVDDDKKLLSGLKRGFYAASAEWDFHFVSSARAALEYLEKNPACVVVADYRMPRMNGYELLKVIQRKWPHIIRIMFTGQPDKSTYIDSISICHYYLWKPLNINKFVLLLDRLGGLSRIIKDRKIANCINSVNKLPTLEVVPSKLISLMQAPEKNRKAITELIKNDVSLAAQVLKLANSSCFTMDKEIKSIEEASLYLGLNTLCNLVITQKIFSIGNLRECKEFDLKGFIQHSISVSKVAEELLKDAADQSALRSASIAGLLHDVGKLVLMHNFPDKYTRVKALAEKRRIKQNYAEAEIIGVDHVMAGAYLAKLWGLPHAVVEAISHHHCSEAEILKDRSAVVRAVWYANRVVNGDELISKDKILNVQFAPEVNLAVN